jgi:hypothetical protein
MNKAKTAPGTGSEKRRGNNSAEARELVSPDRPYRQNDSVGRSPDYVKNNNSAIKCCGDQDAGWQKIL